MWERAPARLADCDEGIVEIVAQWFHPKRVFMIWVKREGIKVDVAKSMIMHRLGISVTLMDELVMRRLARPHFEINTIYPPMAGHHLLLAGSRAGLSWRRTTDEQEFTQNRFDSDAISKAPEEHLEDKALVQRNFGPRTVLGLSLIHI